MSYIYKITNDINDKVYIGQTSFSIKQRFKEHTQEAKRYRAKNRPLYSAINKYGIEHFHIELIEECDYNIVHDREIYWIEYYHSYSQGYNATLGGDGKCLYDYDKIIQLYKEGKTCKEISETLGCCTDIVGKVLASENIDSRINSWNNYKHSIQATFTDGQQILFDSVSDAARWLKENNYTNAKDLNGIVANIGRVANKKTNRKSYLNIKWEYV